MKNYGYETTVAFDSVSGVETALKIRPDLVLVDIGLPAGNGFTVAERIQVLIPTPTPVIFITASTQPEFRERAKEFGAAAFLQKPCDSEELRGAVQLALAEPPASEERRVYQL